MSKEALYCPVCENEGSVDDEFCPDCGALFVDGAKCDTHYSEPAEGVCIICCIAYCKRCANRVNGKFLCNAHSHYEIVEGMAKVYGVSDLAQAEYVKENLESSGLHPFLYSRKSNPLHLGSSDYTLYRIAGDTNRVNINEYKVMVPCQQVLTAEKILREMGMSD